MKKTIENEIQRISELIENSDITSFNRINESSLSRIWNFSKNYDVAIISASRNMAVDCVSTDGKELDEEGKKYTRDENQKRTRELKAYLLNKGYGVTNVIGTWIENFQTDNKIEVSESSLFVVNRSNSPDFFKIIKSLGIYYCQDAVLLKPKDEDAVLYGTNLSWPFLGNVEPAGKFNAGLESQYMTKVGGRPFTFVEDYGPTARFLIDKYSKKLDSNLKLINN